MTPAARIAASIELLDGILAGAPAEKALTTWARRNRYAGAGDRAAIRDHVFDVLRRRRSCAALGGGVETGRALLLGALRGAGRDPDQVFTGQRYAPDPLTAAERAFRPAEQALPRNVALDCPDRLAPALETSLGRDFEAVMETLRSRAPVFLRVNLRRIDRPAAAGRLAGEGVETAPHPLSETALEVTANARRVQGTAAYRDGLVELQDAASQAVVDLLPVPPGGRVLDYCAGGGGKTLAMAGRAEARFFAHDADARRMRDLPGRAARAGAEVTLLHAGAPETAPAFDLVLCDVPCSGSGAWRRNPESKWRLTEHGLARLQHRQAAILDAAAGAVADNGTLAYATCSLLDAENGRQIGSFVARQRGWELVCERRLTPLDGGDGFYAALLQRRHGK